MKAKGVGLFLSLLIHACLVGAYLLTVEPEQAPVASKARASNISLSMFDAAITKPMEPLSQPVLKPEPIKKEPIKKAPIKKEPIKKEPIKKEPIKKEPIKKEPIKKEQPKLVVPSKLKQTTPAPKINPVAVPAQPPVLAKQPEGLSDADRLGIEDDYKNAIRHAILKNRVYPRQARRKRQQGTATVAFRLQKNGVIENLRVIVSSGIERLDKAALQAVGKVQQFDSFPKDVIRQYWDFEIPVSFKLS